MASDVFSIRLPEDVYSAVRAEAERLGRSVAWVIIRHVRRSMRTPETAQPEPDPALTYDDKADFGA